MALFLEGGERTRRPVARQVLTPPDIVTRAPTPHRPAVGVGPSPADERGFIHKRGSFFRRIAKKVVGSVPLVGGVASELIGAIPSFGGGGAMTVPAATGCPPGFFFNVNTQGGRKFGGIPTGAALLNGLTTSIQQPEVTGAEGQLLPFGEAVMGRFGAGLKPAVFSQQRRACPRGSILGAPEADGSSLCYNRRDLSNKERMWPRGRRPLLTGGEMRAISTASSAAKKLQRKTKQLQGLGLLPKPSRRGARAGSPVHVKTAGVAHN